MWNFDNLALIEYYRSRKKVTSLYKINKRLDSHLKQQLML